MKLRHHNTPSGAWGPTQVRATHRSLQRHEEVGSQVLLLTRRGASRLPLKLVVVRKSLMQLIEYARLADRLRQVVTIQVGPQLIFYVGEDQFNVSAGEFRLKFLNDASRAVIYLGNGAGVHQHPTDRRGMFRFRKAADLIGEPAGVGIEKWRSETVDH